MSTCVGNRDTRQRTTRQAPSTGACTRLHAPRYPVVRFLVSLVPAMAAPSSGQAPAADAADGGTTTTVPVTPTPRATHPLPRLDPRDEGVLAPSDMHVQVLETDGVASELPGKVHVVSRGDVTGDEHHEEEEAPPACCDTRAPRVAAFLFGGPGPRARMKRHAGDRRYEVGCVAHTRRAVCRPRGAALLAVLVSGVALSFLVEGVVRDDALADAESSTALTAQRSTLELELSLAQFDDLLASFAGSVYAMMRGGPASFFDIPVYNELAVQLTAALHGTVTGIGFQQAVPDAHRAGFEANMSLYLPEFLDISRPGGVFIHAGNVSVPAPAKDVYYPVRWSTLSGLSPTAILLDTTSVPAPAGPTRERTIALAMSPDNPPDATVYASDPVLLVDSGAPSSDRLPPSYLVYARVGPPGSGYDGLALGVVVTAIVANELVEALLGDTVTLTVAPFQMVATDLSLSDTGDNVELLRFWTGSGPPAGGGGEDESVHLADAQIRVAGRVWNVVTTTTRAALRQHASLPGGVIVATGLVVTLLIFSLGALSMMLSDRRQQEDETRLSARVADELHKKLIRYVCHELRNPVRLRCCVFVGNCARASLRPRSFLRSQVALTQDLDVAPPLRTPTALVPPALVPPTPYPQLHAVAAGIELFTQDHDEALTLSMRSDIAMVRQSVDQMAHVLNDVVDMRTLQEGRVGLSLEPTSVRAVFRDLSNQLRDAVSPQTVFSLSVASDVPELAVLEPLRLRQICGNALHNACKFTSSGSVHIIVQTLVDGSHLLVEVRNSSTRGLAGVSEPAILGETARGTPADVAGRVKARFAASRSTAALDTPSALRSGVRSGHGGHRGSLSPKGAPSEAVQQAVVEWFAESTPSRLSPPARGSLLPPAVAARFDTHVVSRSDTRSNLSLSSFQESGSRGSPAEAVADHTTAALGMLMKATGLGLGMPLSNRLAKRLGGVMGVHDCPSADGRVAFTRWWVVVPIVPVSAEAAPAVAAGSESRATDSGGDGGGGGGAEGGAATLAARASGRESSASPASQVASRSRKAEPLPTDPRTGKPVHVLAVDDEKLLRRMVGRFLESLSATCTLLSDGKELAAELATLDTPPALVLLDIVLLRSDGSVVCKELRESGVTVPIYAMTGNADRSSEATFQSRGFNGLLSKPFSTHDVRATVMHALSGSPRWFNSADAKGRRDKAEAAEVLASTRV